MQISRDLSDGVDTITTEFVDGALGNVISIAIPLITIALTMSFMLRGAMMMVSPGSDALSDLLKRFLGVALIVSFAGAGGFYQTQLADMALGLPDDIANAVLTGTGLGGADLAELIDNTILAGMDVAEENLDNAGIMSGGLTSMVMGAYFIACVVIVCGLAMAYILVSKILLAITVAFGPVFIFLLLFKSTKEMFGKWLGSMINYALLIVLLAAVLSIVMNFFQAALDQTASGDVTYFSGLFSAGMIALAAIVATLKLPGLSSSWSSGVSSSLLGFLPASMAGGAAAKAAGSSASPSPEGKGDGGSGNQNDQQPTGEASPKGGSPTSGATSGGAGRFLRHARS